MTTQEIQYLLQIMNNADIKGQLSIFHAQLMSKLSLQLQQQINQTSKEIDKDGHGDT